MDDAVKTHAAGGDRGGLAPRNRNSGATSGPHGGGEPHGTPLRLGTQSRHGRRAPPERRFTVGGRGKSAARCHRTVLAYWKFESISLQRRVHKPSVPPVISRAGRKPIRIKSGSLPPAKVYAARIRTRPSTRCRRRAASSKFLDNHRKVRSTVNGFVAYPAAATDWIENTAGARP